MAVNVRRTSIWAYHKSAKARATQAGRVIAYVLAHGSITLDDAVREFGAEVGSRRISDLARGGVLHAEGVVRSPRTECLQSVWTFTNEAKAALVPKVGEVAHA